MKQIDKMVMLTRMLRDNKAYTLDIESDLQTQQSYYQDQQRFWKNSQKYQELDTIIQEMRELKKKHDTVLDSINLAAQNLLRQEEVKILQRDYITFDKSVPNVQIMINRIENLNPEFVNVLKREIGYYSDWRWAGIELNPSNGFLTRSLLACDPLYLYTGNVIDKEAVKNNFNNFFSEKRMMFYDNLHHVPQHQLGLAVSINSYEFWPMDPIKTEMRQVFDLLAPGGHYIFTYNDCEHLASLDLCAGEYRAYNTKTLMTNMIQMLGFNIIKHGDASNGAHSFIVAKKPGKLTSQKLSSPLVKIEIPTKSELEKVQNNSDHERYNRK